MTNLTEQALYEAGVYQLETTDPVLAGPGGIDNKQAQQLANRTAYLKEKLELTSAATSKAIKDGLALKASSSHSHTKAQVGLGNVPNYAASDSYNSSSTTTLATSKAIKDGLALKASSSHSHSTNIINPSSPAVGDVLWAKGLTSYGYTSVAHRAGFGIRNNVFEVQWEDQALPGTWINLTNNSGRKVSISTSNEHSGTVRSQIGLWQRIL